MTGERDENPRKFPPGNAEPKKRRVLGIRMTEARHARFIQSIPRQAATPLTPSRMGDILVELWLTNDAVKKIASDYLNRHR